MKTLSASQHPVSSKTINLGKIIICVALLFLTYPDTDVTAQPGPKYATGLNILMATDGIGSSNYEGLYFYTNNLKRGSILKDGAFDYLTRSYFHSNVYCDSLVTAWQLQAQVIQVVSALITGNAQVDGILTIGTLSLSGSGSSSGSIISSTGAIDFGNNNLSTTGNITAGGKISAASATITDSLATGNLSADNGYVETLNADNGNIETLHAASLHATSLHSDTFSVTGTSTFSSLTDTTNGIAVINKYGSLQRLNFSDNNSDVLFGNGTFGSLGTATGWQWYDTTVLLSTAPVVAVQNNLVVGGRVSIGAIRMSNGTGTDSMRTAQNFAIEARKIFFEADTVNIRRRIEAKQIAVDTLTATGIAAGSMTASNMAAPVGRIDTLISDRMRTAQLTVSGDIEALNGTVRSNEVSATKIQSALVQTDSLDVNGSIHIKDSIKIGNSIWLAGKGADPSIHNSIYSTNGPLIIQSNNNFGNNVIINAYNHSGKVGIGTIDPQKMLHVKTNHSVIGQEDPSGGSSHYGIRL
ncbi:MAG: hypothetical protein HYY40_11475, partial [Bacteroidetes bacterium]|nr:hypothetical protein [Bacteroidota bacterium]